MADQEQRFWIVGESLADTDQGVAWDFQGLFATEAEAVAVCDGHPTYWIAPVVLGRRLPEEAGVWPGLYFPHSEAAPAKG